VRNLCNHFRERRPGVELEVESTPLSIGPKTALDSRKRGEHRAGLWLEAIKAS